MYLFIVAALLVAWRNRQAIGQALADLAALFEVPRAKIDAEILGIQLPAQVDWSVYDAPAYLRRR